MSRHQSNNCFVCIERDCIAEYERAFQCEREQATCGQDHRAARAEVTSANDRSLVDRCFTHCHNRFVFSQRFKPNRRYILLLILGWIVYATTLLATVANVPFHPDESTSLFLSQDFDTLFIRGDIQGVVWGGEPYSEASARVRYRLLDAPFTRYAIGFSRWAFGNGSAALPVDWDWALDWEGNVRAGALPAPELLRIARLPATLLAVFTPVIVFLIGRHIGGAPFGAIAAILYAANSFVLLHNRRAMSEGPLLFFILLAFLVALRFRSKLFLLGITVGLAASAKATGLILLTVALFAALARPAENAKRSVGAYVRPLVLLTGGFGLAMFIFNPALWRQPVAAAQEMVRARNTLASEQTTQLRIATPGLVPESIFLRVAALPYQSMFAPLAFWDVPNYAEQTALQEAAYLGRFWHPIFASPVLGSLFLVLAFAGMLMAVIHHSPQSARMKMLWLWTASTVLGLLILIPIAWQRYYLPLAPLLSLWVAFALVQIIARVREQRSTPND